MKLTKDCQTRLQALKRNGKKKQYEQAMKILGELGVGVQVTQNQRADSRIPNCVKFELTDGYRIVFQEIEGSARDYLALYVGSHDEIDRFLDNHKGWIFDPEKQGLKELRWATLDESRVNIVHSKELKRIQAEKPNASPNEIAFAGLSSDHLLKAGVPPDRLDVALRLTDPDSLPVMNFLDPLPPRTQDILLAYLTGNPESKAEIVLLLEGKREYVPLISNASMTAVERSTDEFVDLRELPEEQKAFDSLPMEEWMLFLHPDQKKLVIKSFDGPARIRGVSGSGKTVVAIHRAREVARKIIQDGSNEHVLFLTFNKSLSDLVGELLNRLCTQLEAKHIQVSTVDRWCRDYVTFRYGTLPFWDDDVRDEVWIESMRSQELHLLETKLLPKQGYNKKDKQAQFIEEEIEYIYGKFLHSERNGYLNCDRRGRGLRLTPDQRKAVLQLYTVYAESLLKKRQYTPREINRNAYDLLFKDQASERIYRSVIVDEVQDLSEVELRIVHLLSKQSNGELLLVGDGAQRIYARGYSMRNLGIDIRGRGYVLRKNYRNTQEITRAAAGLMIGEGIGKYDDDPEVSQALATESVHIGEKPLLMIAANPTQEWNAVVKEIRYLTARASIPSHEICCLARTKWERNGLIEHLKKSGLPAIEYQAEGVVADNYIKISSLHNAKGHEFRAVFILGLFDGAVPLYIYTEPEDLEKEASLLYVAMTRAKEMLYLSYPKVDQKGKRLNGSRFLNHMKDSIEEIEL